MYKYMYMCDGVLGRLEGVGRGWEDDDSDEGWGGEGRGGKAVCSMARAAGAAWREPAVPKAQAPAGLVPPLPLWRALPRRTALRRAAAGLTQCTTALSARGATPAGRASGIHDMQKAQAQGSQALKLDARFWIPRTHVGTYPTSTRQGRAQPALPRLQQRCPCCCVARGPGGTPHTVTQWGGHLVPMHDDVAAVGKGDGVASRAGVVDTRNGHRLCLPPGMEGTGAGPAP